MMDSAIARMCERGGAFAPMSRGRRSLAAQPGDVEEQTSRISTVTDGQ